MKATNLIMNSSLSFMGKISLNFLNDGFINLNPVWLCSPYILHTNSIHLELESTGLFDYTKTKKPEYKSYSSFSQSWRSDLNQRPADYE